MDLYPHSEILKAIRERADFTDIHSIGTNEPYPARDHGVSYRSNDFRVRYTELMKQEEIVYAVYSLSYVLLWVLRDGTVELAFNRTLTLSPLEKAIYEAYTDMSTVEWMKNGEIFKARYLDASKRNARVMELLGEKGVGTITLG